MILVRPYKAGDWEKVKEAIEHMRVALRLLKEAGVIRTPDRVRWALSSALGAERNTFSRKFRSEFPHLFGGSNG